jgi:hypothetical protein
MLFSASISKSRWGRQLKATYAIPDNSALPKGAHWCSRWGAFPNDQKILIYWSRVFKGI